MGFIGILFKPVLSAITGKVIKKYIAALPYVLVVLLCSYLYISKVNTEKELITTEQSLVDSQKEADSLNTKLILKIESENKLLGEVESQNEKVINLLEESREITEINQELRSKLDSFKGRENVLIKKPTLVERRVNNGTHRIMQSISNETKRDSGY